jgi:hypothetical protein
VVREVGGGSSSSTGGDGAEVGRGDFFSLDFASDGGLSGKSVE